MAVLPPLVTAAVGSAGVPEWSLRAGIVASDDLARELRDAARVLDMMRAIREGDQ